MDTENKIISDSEIMQHLLDELRFTAPAFTKELGYKSFSTIYHILDGRNKISDDLINKIIKKFPEVHYWFLRRGKKPIILNEKLKMNQAELLGVKIGVESPDNNLEILLTLKNIEKILLKTVELLENKK